MGLTSRVARSGKEPPEAQRVGWGGEGRGARRRKHSRLSRRSVGRPGGEATTPPGQELRPTQRSDWRRPLLG